MNESFYFFHFKCQNINCKLYVQLGKNCITYYALPCCKFCALWKLIPICLMHQHLYLCILLLSLSISLSLIIISVCFLLYLGESYYDVWNVSNNNWKKNYFQCIKIARFKMNFPSFFAGGDGGCFSLWKWQKFLRVLTVFFFYVIYFFN